MGSAGSLPNYAIDTVRDMNGVEHNTFKYDVMTRSDNKARLVVRRGQQFYLRCQLNDPYEPSNFTLHVKFVLDGHEVANSRHGTVTLGNDSGRDGGWGFLAEPTVINAISIHVFTPVNAPIGQWIIFAEIVRNGTNETIEMNQKFDLLFNPWLPEDPVYLESFDAREEYVMSDGALIWQGLVDTNRPTMWKYSQFDCDILDCTYHLLFEVGKIPFESRHDPVLVARTLCAYINNNTGNGVLIGNWGPRYKGGTEPREWLGSRKILQQYYTTKQPVKFGQCWVFSGVLGTVCRALGIPCRATTAYEAAHDTNLSLTAERFVVTGDNIDLNYKECHTEFIWNFHVWNEIWSKRDDLAGNFEHYVGWQAVDSTPPLNSTALHQRGPAPLLAVKEGQINVNYDCNYIFAEVNADEVVWNYMGVGKTPVYDHTNTEKVGQSITTQAILSTEAEDITHLYKYPEGSEEAKKAMEVAKKLNESMPKVPHICLKSAITLAIDYDFQIPNNVMIGSPFSVVLNMRNTDIAEYKIEAIIHVETAYYTHRTRGEKVKDTTILKYVKPNDTSTISLDISWDDYHTKLNSECMFIISCTATFSDTPERFIAQKSFQLMKPKIAVEKITDPVVGKSFRAKASFDNPLPIPLTNGIFLVDGPGLDNQMEIKLNENIQTGKKASCEFTLTPKFGGNAAIAVKFMSTELDDVNGFLIIKAKSTDNRRSLCPLS